MSREVSKRFWRFFGASALLHILLILFIFSPWIRSLQILEIAPPPPQKITLTLAPTPKLPPKPQPKKQYFIDSAQLTPSPDKPAEATPFISDRNTRAVSTQPAKDESVVFMPSQSGEKIPELNTRDSAFSPENQRPPSPSQPKPERTSSTPVVAEQKLREFEPQERPLKEHSDLTFAQEEDKPLKPKEDKPREEPTPPQHEARPPPNTFTAQRRKSAIAGGAQETGDEASVASQETLLGRYKSKLYRAIGSRWYLYVQNRITLLSIGQARLKFYVRANGVIENIQYLEGDPNTTLGVLSRRSITDVGRVEPFPPELKQQLGEGYWEEITFTIY